MNNTPQSTPTTPTATSSTMRSEIAQKWGKLSAEDIASLRTNADLVAKVQNKYSVDQAHAQREVDTFAKGRQI